MGHLQLSTCTWKLLLIRALLLRPGSRVEMESAWAFDIAALTDWSGEVNALARTLTTLPCSLRCLHLSKELGRVLYKCTLHEALLCRVEPHLEHPCCRPPGVYSSVDQPLGRGHESCSTWWARPGNPIGRNLEALRRCTFLEGRQQDRRTFNGGQTIEEPEIPQNGIRPQEADDRVVERGQD